ncbi:MAG TPA: phosphate ABC transporter permease PstA [Thermoleophilaceae bacterium]|nr:phosphate ABC transporter permease PstA [Thermoleophilaceae bacterium]
MSTVGIGFDQDFEDAPRPFDPFAPLSPSGNLRRRKVTSAVVQSGATLAAVVAVVVLVIVVWSVFKNGAEALSWSFLTSDLPQFGQNGGGIGPAIVGTAIIVAIATAIAMPLGVLIALYLTEFASARIGNSVRLTLDLINGLPSIVIAVFIFGLLVAGHHGSGFAAAVALAIIELPLIARGSQEVLLLVPNTLREGADALGVSKRRSVLGVILPAAMGGILTSTVLAVARAAGETAPVLILSSIFNNNLHGNPFEPLANIPVLIFQLSEQPDPAGYARAWGAGFVLLSFILIASLAGRMALARSRNKLTK